MKKNLLVFLLILPCMAFSQDLSLGLRAYYPFSGNANDASGNNNNPVFNNATLTTDALGNPNSAYHFNGTNSYIQVPNAPSLNMTTQMSIAAKVRPMGWYTGPCYNNMMVIKGDADNLPGIYAVRYADVYTGCTTPDITTERFYGIGTVADFPIVQLNQWYNVVWTYDGTSARLYVDCVLQETAVTSFGSFTSSYDLFIGHMNNVQYPYWLNGDLDEIRIYDRPLTQQEVNLYGQCSVAPVSLLDITASVVNNKSVKIAWNTAAESNIKDYSVMRSTTGYESDFILMGTVVSNNNSTVNNYSFTDNTAKPNTLYYYKLIINDKDGSKKNSPIRTARITNKNIYSLIYPNPTTDKVKIVLHNTSGAQVSVTNQVGQVILTKKVVSFNAPFEIDLSNVAKGTYWISIQADGEKIIEKIIRQ